MSDNIEKPAREYFSKVREAKEALRERALQAVNQYTKALEQAQAAGDFESAIKGWQWLLEHLPANEDGERVIAESVDRPKIEKGHGGPSIQIGFAIGGLPKQKELPAVEVIDVTKK